MKQTTAAKVRPLFLRINDYYETYDYFAGDNLTFDEMIAKAKEFGKRNKWVKVFGVYEGTTAIIELYRVGTFKGVYCEQARV